MEKRKIRRLLEAQHTVLIQQIINAEHRLTVPIEPSPDRLDWTTSRITRERIAIQLAESKQLLGQIETALARMDYDTYGTCLACGKAINPDRLVAIPYASLGFRCQTRQEEMNLVRG